MIYFLLKIIFIFILHTNSKFKAKSLINRYYSFFFFFYFILKYLGIILKIVEASFIFKLTFLCTFKKTIIKKYFFLVGLNHNILSILKIIQTTLYFHNL